MITIRWMNGVLVLAIPFAAAAQADVEQIRQLRDQSNDAIARHDVPAIVSFLDPEFQITTGSGTFLEGVDAMAVAFAEQFAAFEIVRYVRTPRTIEIGSGRRLGYEEGTWVGTWTSVTDGPHRTGGRYAAYWRQVDGRWKIHAELFVTLFCEGRGC